MSNSHFRVGSGCFTCDICGKRTRSTGAHLYANQSTCDECIEMQEQENGINDNTGLWSPEYMAKMVAEQQKREKAFEERQKKYGVVKR